MVICKYGSFSSWPNQQKLVFLWKKTDGIGQSGVQVTLVPYSRSGNGIGRQIQFLNAFHTPTHYLRDDSVPDNVHCGGVWVGTK